MKKAFIVTSIIDLDNTHPLTYSEVRTHFSSEERFRQTIFTVASLDKICGPDDTIFLLDASDNYESYRGALSYQQNLVFVSVKEEFPEIYETVRTHSNKSHCESLTLVKFVEKYRTKLEEYDYFFKMTGRYFTDSSFDVNIFNEDNLDKIFFKKPFAHEWNDNWNYQMVDRRNIQGDNLLKLYPSVLYSWGRMNLDRIIDIYRCISVFTEKSQGTVYSFETLLYFFTRVYESNIVEVDWRVYGWDGTNGTFMRY
jgi:hypothetical protein